MTTWNDVVAAGLIDEPHVMVGADVLVHGVLAFSLDRDGEEAVAEHLRLAVFTAPAELITPPLMTTPPWLRGSSTRIGSVTARLADLSALHASEVWCPA